MNLFSKICFFLLLSASLPAQIVDTVGGMGSSPNRANLAKANVFSVDKTVMLLKLEIYLNVPGAETLTFFRYRHHSQKGAYLKDWSKVVKVNGTGAAWYSPGQIVLPMIAGNHYLLGVSWVGATTYYYNLGTTGQPLSFGTWYSGRTPTGIPSSISIGGVDRAQYYQRLTSVPFGRVLSIGTPCTSATSPRLVAAELAAAGGKFSLDLVESAASTPAVFVLGRGAALAKAIPVFGCSLWLNPTSGLILTFPTMTSSTGTASLNLPIPNDPWYSGFVLSWQGIVVGKSATPLTNAVQFTL